MVCFLNDFSRQAVSNCSTLTHRWIVGSLTGFTVEAFLRSAFRKHPTLPSR
ncbi:hypothetical protein RBSH_00351 [Rhodopirellula baltica SH28]|uniref:Uncharacterized protein n=1 Tax=Rhodopirellula baltica SH28 TaxID=993517 RepID=K5DN77_RHOBT|nr:hypothetical protein RBSH_00351 [Rhodopirellula baltica SH28]